MRKFGLFLLLTASAVPAMAAMDDEPRFGRGDRGDRAAAQSDNREHRAVSRERSGDVQSSRREERMERIERARSGDQGSPSGGFGTARRGDGIGRPQPVEQVSTVQVQDVGDSEVRSNRFGRRGDGVGRPQPVEQPSTIQVQDGDDTTSNRIGRRGDGVRRGGRDDPREPVQVGANGSWQPRDRSIRTIPGTIARPLPGMTSPERPASTVDRRLVHRDRDGDRWNHRWRGDRRYDWRNYRDRHRSRFHIGFYFDPFGWNYRRFSIGSYMWPTYYSSRYWISDPWEYRLPPAYGPYRWVRYHNDALLIDTWTGEVVDVIWNFFW
jgi:hypothetical protein